MHVPRAVVFDCDGTLADTEPLSDLAWREALAEVGYHATDDDLRAVIGHPGPRTLEYFEARAPIGDRAAFVATVRARFKRLLEERLRLHDDAERTLRSLAARGVPLAIASSSRRDHVVGILRWAGIDELVRAVVGADDVTRHKPDPEPYLTAAAALGQRPQHCTAVEDTPVGVASAVAAGMFTVAVLRDGFERGHLAEAHRVVDEVTLASLCPDPVGT